MFARSLASYAGPPDPRQSRNGSVVSPSPEEVREALLSANRFVYAASSEPSAAFDFARLLEFVGIPDALARTDVFLIDNLSGPGLSKAFAQGNTEQTKSGLRQRIDQGQVKRYFDWNWNKNALVLFRAALQQVGLPAEAVISKYELQLLYFLAGYDEGPQRPRLTESGIFMEMHMWHGTGKYEGLRLGSAASRDAIVQHLVEKDFIEIHRPGENGHTHEAVLVTEKARRFLALLHPDCCDLDLPGRIERWMAAGFNVSQPKIDRYLRSYFGKQKRFGRSRRAAG
jgi:hypothetical protein